MSRILLFLHLKNEITMKKTLFFLLVALASCAPSTPKGNIMESQDIAEIENFLKTAHREDPRRTVLKQKLITLKNKAWTKQNAGPAMKARPLPDLTDESKEVKTVAFSDEEFKKLMMEYETKHSQRTLNLLNQLFDNDPTNSKTIVLIKNQSDCNLVMKIQGKDFYQLPVPAKGENSIVIEKGDYEFSGVLCGTVYASKKNVHKNMIISLTAPTSIQN